MASIKVLVVDDSLFMRKMVSDLIQSDPSMEVIGTAKNGLEAIRMTKEKSPDVITMDVEMPEMNGLDALRAIMREKPTPIIMLSSLTSEGARETIQALQWGAVDFIQKPSGSISLDIHTVQDDLVTKIKVASKASIRNLLPTSAIKPAPSINKEVPKDRSVLNSISTGHVKAIDKVNQTASFDQLFAIGTSTGGPRALEAVITALPNSFSYPVLVVQHMPPKFTKSLAQRLDQLSKVNVVEAEDRQLIQGGTVYIAPGGWHMEIREKNSQYYIHLHQEEPRNGHRPSVDVLYESVLAIKKLKKHYVIMTGMGGDGAKGMLEAKKAGAQTTIAESADTAIIFGMPKVAIELGGVDHILPLHQIANKMVEVAKGY